MQGEYLYSKGSYMVKLAERSSSGSKKAGSSGPGKHRGRGQVNADGCFSGPLRF